MPRHDTALWTLVSDALQNGMAYLLLTVLQAIHIDIVLNPLSLR